MVEMYSKSLRNVKTKVRIKSFEICSAKQFKLALKLIFQNSFAINLLKKGDSFPITTSKVRDECCPLVTHYQPNAANKQDR